MMNFLLRLLSYFLLLSLSACVIQPKVMVAKTHVLNQCTMMCMERFDSCKQQCTNNCSNCSLSARHTATINYLKYVHEQQVEGGIITRGLKSYRDPLQCRKVTCNCKADLMICKQGCAGVIPKKLRPLPYCI